MSNFDKIVKLACKPKNAPPKSKVSRLSCIPGSMPSLRISLTFSLSLGLSQVVCRVSHIPRSPFEALSDWCSTLIAATFSDDGSLNDIIRSLSLRLREPNAVVSVAERWADRF